MKRRISWIVGPVLILAVLATLLLEQMLPFGILFVETIDRQFDFYSSYARDYAEKSPAILVITSMDEAANPGLGVQFPPDILQRLERVDYGRYFVVCVFHGQRGSTGSEVGIQYLLRQGNTIIVQAKFLHPFNQLTRPAFSSPYHIVQAPKGHLSGVYRFILRSETGETAEATHTIP